MPRKFLKRFLPSADKIKSYRSLRYLNQFLHREDLWHIHQRCIANALFIGVFTAFIPIPGHIFMVAVLALLFRANLIVSLLIIWINNPLTIAPLFYLNYLVGSRVIGSHVQAIQFEFSWAWLAAALPTIGAELFLGALMCGFFFGGLSYITARLIWRWRVTYNWQLRQQKRQAVKQGSQ